MQNFLQNGVVMGIPFSGPDGNAWGTPSARKQHSPDLITLCPRVKEDPFSAWVVEKAITKLFCCLRFKKPSSKHGVIGYEDATVLKITYCITTVLASLILIASITVLYCIHSMPARLVVISAFNILLSVCLIAFTNAKRAEVFAITAASVPTSISHMFRLTTVQFCGCSSRFCEHKQGLIGSERLCGGKPRSEYC